MYNLNIKSILCALGFLLFFATACNRSRHPGLYPLDASQATPPAFATETPLPSPGGTASPSPIPTASPSGTPIPTPTVDPDPRGKGDRIRCDSGASTSGMITYEFTNFGNRPTTHVFLPSRYDCSVKWRVVFAIHGCGQTGFSMMDALKLDRDDPNRDYFLVLPESSYAEDGFKMCWDSLSIKQPDYGDHDYILTILENLRKQYSIDTTQIYAIGHSSGGAMSHRLACEPGSYFSAVATLASSTYKESARCVPTHPVNVMMQNTLEDPIIKYEGDVALPPVEDIPDRWAQFNGCSGEPTLTPSLDLFTLSGNDTNRSVWNQCQSGGSVEFWSVYGHFSNPDWAHNPIAFWTSTARERTFKFVHLY